MKEQIHGFTALSPTDGQVAFLALLRGFPDRACGYHGLGTFCLYSLYVNKALHAEKILNVIKWTLVDLVTILTGFTYNMIKYIT